MVRDILNGIKVEVLFETGMKKAKTIYTKTRVPLRIVQRHVAKLNRGESLERKS